MWSSKTLSCFSHKLYCTILSIINLQKRLTRTHTVWKADRFLAARNIERTFYACRVDLLLGSFSPTSLLFCTLHDLADGFSFRLLWAYQIFLKKPVIARSMEEKPDWLGNMSSQILWNPNSVCYCSSHLKYTSTLQPRQ